MKKVLVVDDNPSIQLLLAEALQYDYEVAAAYDGEEAIEFLTEHEDVDAVLLDVEMPHTNGWEALQVIRDQQDGWPNAKVVMVTCLNQPEEFLKAMVLNADFYVTKPFDIAQLLMVLQEALKTQ